MNSIYINNFKKLENYFIKKVGFNIFIKECVKEVLEKNIESNNKNIDKIILFDGLLQTKLTFK